MRKTLVKIPKIIVICGPTATGKSDFAVALAKKIGGEVISADSRQVYRGLNIGTGKITKREMKGVPHHLLDVASPRRIYTVADYVKDASKIVRYIVQKGKIPIICGGSGFYIGTLLGEWPTPEVPPNKKLREMLSRKSLSALFAILQKLDPARAEAIDAKNSARLIRAIEIAKVLGKIPPPPQIPETIIEPLFSCSQEYENKGSVIKIVKIGLDFPDKTLKKRIALRLKKRLRQGMLAEARELHASGLSWKRMEAFGLEYRYLARLLQKKITREEFESELLKKIWQYAKRQRTWFRKDKEIAWILKKGQDREKCDLGLSTPNPTPYTRKRALSSRNKRTSEIALLQWSLSKNF